MRRLQRALSFSVDFGPAPSSGSARSLGLAGHLDGRAVAASGGLQSHLLHAGDQLPGPGLHGKSRAGAVAEGKGRTAAAAQRRAVDVALLRAGLGSMLPVKGARSAARMTTRAIRAAGATARAAGGGHRARAAGKAMGALGLGLGVPSSSGPSVGLLAPVREVPEHGHGQGAAAGGAGEGEGEGGREKTLEELEVIQHRGDAGGDQSASHGGARAGSRVAVGVKTTSAARTKSRRTGVTEEEEEEAKDDAVTADGVSAAEGKTVSSTSDADVDADEDDDGEEDEDADSAVDTEERFCSKLHALWNSYELPPAALTDLLSALQSHPDMDTDELPATAAQLERRVALRQAQSRPRCAAFGHSLERNGANNFLLYLVRSLMRDGQEFELFSPKEGPMRGDFEAMGVPVHVVDTAAAGYVDGLRDMLRRAKASGRFGCCFANTIMRAEVVAVCKELGLPSAWTIHEAWPRDQIDAYAKKVFLVSNIDSGVIREGFKAAPMIIFPAKVQQALYSGLFNPGCARVVYNGIPMRSIDTFRASQDRDAVRRALGYGREDFLVLHLGTVCKRKAQDVSLRAFHQLVKARKQALEAGADPSGPWAREPKLLLVGARYIRQHEIDFQAELRGYIKEHAADLEGRVTIMDIQKEVLRFYHAADAVLVPSRNEVLPLVICEAMAFQRPVVCSRIDGIPEAVTHDEDGLLVEPDDVRGLSESIVRLFESPALRSRLGQNGRARVLRQFSYSVMSKQYRELVDQVTFETYREQEQEQVAAATMTGLGPLQQQQQQQQRRAIAVVAEEGESKAAEEGRIATATASLAGPDPAAPDSPASTLGKQAPVAGGGRKGCIPKVASGVSVGQVSLGGQAPGGASSGAGSSSILPGGGADKSLVAVRRPAPRAPLPAARQPVVLVDMDSTIVDFDGSFLKRWLPKHPGDEALVRSRRHYELEKNFPVELREEVTKTIAAPGLYIAMKPIEGALDTLQDMLEHGLDVRLVTSPHPSCYAACAAEKFQWVSDHLGDEWCARLVIARDKTHVRGRWLIDDKPKITGSSDPAWEHVIFAQPWNDEVDAEGRSRMRRWSDWRKVLRIK